jgi:hypothetical protein
MVGSYDFHTATLLGDGRVLVVGGSANPDAQTAAELFDPGTERWTATGSMAEARDAYTATLLLDGKVLVAGGYSGDPLASAEVYDPSSGRWTATGSMNRGRGGHTATLLPDGRVLVVGGTTEAILMEGGPRSAAAELYDPSSGKWTATASMGEARTSFSATLLRDGRVLVAGGDGGFQAAELYDPSSERWAATGSMADGRIGHSATLLADGKVLVAGGCACSEPGAWASAELYHPSSGKWTATGSMGTARIGHAAATLLPDGRVLVAGGDPSGGPATAELYDPSSGEWTATASPLMAPDGTATLLRDGTVLVVSGNFAQLYDPWGRHADEPAVLAATLPVRGSAREVGLGIQMAPGADGTLFVSIPASTGSILLALLDTAGRPRPGWPVVLDGATSCGQLLPVDDGSVRVLCTMENPGSMYSPISAFAFDSASRLLDGWPVGLRGSDYTGRVIGDVLTLAEHTPGSDVITPGEPSHTIGLVTVAADGGVRSGAPVPILETWPWDRWAIDLDGVAYGVQGSVPSPAVSQITALDLSGVRSGWPISFEGIGSGPAIRPDGRIVVTVASSVPRTSRVLAFDPDRAAVAASSAELPIATGEIVFVDGPYECGLPVPKPPLVARGGTTFVFSEIDTAIFALDPSLDVVRGWPYRPATALEGPNPNSEHDGISCPSLAIPAVGLDGTLYLLLRAREPSVGGSLVAVGPDGRVRSGWPVDLKRPGAEFWSVVVGSDGTVYALAIEPESSGRSSASILAIAPDSTVLYTTTILDP